MAEREAGTAFEETALSGGRVPIADLLAVGSRFADRYLVAELLGTGGMGAVYRVHDERLDEDVALKVMSFTHEDAARRFTDEVRLARRVTHPNVARTHDIGEHAGRHYFTMEYVRGETLDDLLARHGALAPAQAAGFGAQIAAGLEAAHVSGVIHLDLKPGNVLLSEDGRALITDFGISRARGADVRQTGVIGTPAFMSPEQACGSAVDARSDLYALGTMLYEMVAGRLPFEETDAMASAMARLRRAAPDVRKYAQIPSQLGTLIMALLAREPDQRPGNTGEVRAALEALAAGSTATLRLRASAGEHALAVLPFRYRGPAEHDYLGQGLAEELIDALSRTRGLKVLALGTVARFADARDPIHVGTELGVDSVIDGQVKMAEGILRIAVRMNDARQGLQIWSEHVDLPVTDLFHAEESLARRIAEALRLELGARPVDRDIPLEAVESYLRARRLLRRGVPMEAAEALAMLTRVLELAPDFEPALACHAMAAVRAYWLENTGAPKLRAESEASIARAQAQAANLPETHLSAGMMSVQLGNYRDAARAFKQAEEIAPTMAEAQQNLGTLEVEAGRMLRGMDRLRFSLELDASLNISRMTLMRTLDYLGETAESLRLLEELRVNLGDQHIGLLVTRARRAMRYRDGDEIKRVLELVDHAESHVGAALPQFMRLIIGVVDLPVGESAIDQVAARMGNPRFICGMRQFCAEGYTYSGHLDHALTQLTKLVDGILVDIEWLDRCPTLAPLRGHPTFVAVAHKIRVRAAGVWVP